MQSRTRLPGTLRTWCSSPRQSLAGAFPSLSPRGTLLVSLPMLLREGLIGDPERGPSGVRRRS
eukprot:13926033-Alexandrium_andersonii.AAC.1